MPGFVLETRVFDAALSLRAWSTRILAKQIDKISFVRRSLPRFITCNGYETIVLGFCGTSVLCAESAAVSERPPRAYETAISFSGAYTSSPVAVRVSLVSQLSFIALPEVAVRGLQFSLHCSTLHAVMVGVPARWRVGT